MIDDIFSMNLVPRLVVVIPTTSLRISVETVEEVDFRQPLEHVMTITFHRSHTHSRTHHFIGTRGGKGGYFGQVSVLAARAIDGSGNSIALWLAIVDPFAGPISKGLLYSHTGSR